MGIYPNCPRDYDRKKNDLVITFKLTIMGLEPFGFFGMFFGLVSIVLGIAWFVCCLVLFFKVWGMCNDVKQILRILEQKINLG